MLGGYVEAKADALVAAEVYFDVVSVGATINAILASVFAAGTTVLENAAREPHIVDLANFLNSMGADIRGAGTDSIRIQGVERLHALGFRTAAMALTDNSVSIDDARLAAEPRLAIVLGTEGDGLSPRTIAACDYTVKIPMAHGVDSLNVAAASAVAFWQLRAK